MKVTAQQRIEILKKSISNMTAKNAIGRLEKKLDRALRIIEMYSKEIDSIIADDIWTRDEVEEQIDEIRARISVYIKVASWLTSEILRQQEKLNYLRIRRSPVASGQCGCFICGSQRNKLTGWVHYSWTGELVRIAHETRTSQGCFEVCSSCRSQLPKSFSSDELPFLTLSSQG